MTGPPMHNPIADAAGAKPLRARIALICHAIRWLTFGYVVFVLWGLYAYWSDRAAVARGYAAVYKFDISGAASTQYAAAIALNLVVWAALAWMCWGVWRLFGRYIQGDIFSRISADLLQRIGMLGLFTVALDVVTRPAVIYVMGLHLPDRSDARHMFVRTEDVLYVLIALIIIALGIIYKAAAEMADEHAQVV